MLALLLQNFAPDGMLRIIPGYHLKQILLQHG